MEQSISGSLRASNPCGVLTSFFYYKTYDFSQIPDNVPLILDSGAFSAYTQGKVIDIEAYIEWCQALEGRYDFAFNLDELGDEKTSLERWEYLTAEGVETAPVIHYGSKPENVLPAYLEQGADIIAFGGLVGSGANAQAVGWSSYVLKWLKENAPQARTHGLGVHGSSRLARLPFTTIDSSSPTAAFKFARLPIYNPITHKWQTIALNGKEIYRHRKLLEVYGMIPEKVAVSNPTTRADIAYLLAISEITGTEAYRRKMGRERTSYNVLPASHQGSEYLKNLRRSYLATASTQNISTYTETLRCSYLATTSTPILGEYAASLHADYLSQNNLHTDKETN